MRNAALLIFRLVESKDTSFFLSPAPTLSVEEITVSMPIDSSQYNSEVVPALLVWMPQEYRVAESGGIRFKYIIF